MHQGNQSVDFLLDPAESCQPLVGHYRDLKQKLIGWKNIRCHVFIIYTN